MVRWLALMDKKGIERILIKEVATILGIDAEEINVQSNLAELGLDSLSFVELLVLIEKQFGINLMESGLSKEDFESINFLASRIDELNKK